MPSPHCRRRSSRSGQKLQTPGQAHRAKRKHELRVSNATERGNPALRQQGTLKIMERAAESLDALRIRTAQEQALANLLVKQEARLSEGTSPAEVPTLQDERVLEHSLKRAA